MVERGDGGDEGGQGKGQARAVQLFRVKEDRLGREHNNFYSDQRVESELEHESLIPHRECVE